MASVRKRQSLELHVCVQARNTPWRPVWPLRPADPVDPVRPVNKCLLQPRQQQAKTTRSGLNDQHWPTPACVYMMRPMKLEHHRGFELTACAVDAIQPICAIVALHTLRLCETTTSPADTACDKPTVLQPKAVSSTPNNKRCHLNTNKDLGN